MAAKTRAEIFAESERRYPDFGDMKHHGQSLGFEEAATWASTLAESPAPEAVEFKAFELFPEGSEPAERTVSGWRREGFFAGVAWIWPEG